jgi:hypothetical protein
MFLVLGAVTAVGPNEQVVALSDRQRALLASLLARAGTVVSVDMLVELIWPDDQPGDPQAALYNKVSRLRRAAPFARVVTVAPGYRLDVGPADVDSHRFDRLVRADTIGSLAEALELWRGQAYAEFTESPVARFEAIRLEERAGRRPNAGRDRRRRLGRPRRARGIHGQYPLDERTPSTCERCTRRTPRGCAHDGLRFAGRLADELGLEPRRKRGSYGCASSARMCRPPPRCGHCVRVT